MKHKRSLICRFRFLIWESGKLKVWQGDICRTPNKGRARISYFGLIYRNMSETKSEVLAFVNTPSMYL